MKTTAILIVDDEEIIRQLCQRVLSKPGYRLVLSDSAREALAQMDKQPFDWLITDLKLGDMNGIDLIHQFKRKFPDAKVALMTGTMDVGEESRQVETLNVQWIQKPFQVEDLRAVLNVA